MSKNECLAWKLIKRKLKPRSAPILKSTVSQLSKEGIPHEPAKWAQLCWPISLPFYVWTQNKLNRGVHLNLRDSKKGQRLGVYRIYLQNEHHFEGLYLGHFWSELKKAWMSIGSQEFQKMGKILCIPHVPAKWAPLWRFYLSYFWPKLYQTNFTCMHRWA